MVKKSSLEEMLYDMRAKGLEIGTAEDTIRATESWSTGNIALDSIIGVGGFPIGRIIELYGPSMSGKSSSALQGAAVVQQLIKDGDEEGCILFLDYEQALDLDYAKALGIDHEHPSFVYMSPTTLEEGINAYRQLLEAGYVRLCIVDSVAAMISEKESQAETGAITVADRAKALQQTCRQILGPLRRNRSSIIFLNHILDAINTGFGAMYKPKTTTPGGKAIGYYASLRIEFKRSASVKSSMFDVVTGTKLEQVNQVETTATVIKNKVAKPSRQATLRIRYGKGFSQPWSVFQVLLAHGVVTRKTSKTYKVPDSLAIGGKTEFTGSETLMEVLESSPKAIEVWTQAAQECLDKYTDDTVTFDEVEESTA